MAEDQEKGPAPDAAGRGFHFLLSAALLVIVVAGLKASTSLVVPLLLAGFIALICMPLMKRIMAIGAPSWVPLVK